MPCLIYLYTNQLKLKGPNYNVATCLKRDMSYTIQLYISSEYSYPLETKKDIKIKNLPSKIDEKGKNIRVKQDIFWRNSINDRRRDICN